jgi:NAD(P)H-hydrate epimerase
VTVEQMRQVESAADAAGHTYAKMMDLAGAAVAQEIIEATGGVEGQSILILVGTGNNGGDGLVAGDLLADQGAQVSVYLTKGRDQQDQYVARLRERGVLIAVAEDDQRNRVLKLQLGKADVLVDAVLGTGFQLPLRGAAQEVLATVRQALSKRDTMPLIVAVDCPSGIDCDTGEAAPETPAADLTITLAAAKPGLLRLPGAGLVGRLVVRGIGLDDRALEHINTELVTARDVAPLIPARSAFAHKGTFGRALIVAGSRNYPGAAALAARAAYQVGAGLVTLVVPQSIQAMLVPQIVEATWIPIPDERGSVTPVVIEALEEEWTSTDAMLVGPGFGLDPLAAEATWQLLQKATSMLPTVVDADALKHLASHSEWHTELGDQMTLTPHPGEMSVLTGMQTQDIQADRTEVARSWARDWGQIVMLKGAHTVIADPDGRARILPFATASLAKAGTGDVLAGALVGLLAQQIAPFDATTLAGYLHGRAGELAAEAIGSSASVLAGDVAELLPHAIAELNAVRG